MNKRTFKDFDIDSKTAKELACAIKQGKTIIVAGTQGPSGKTSLTRLINDLDGNAIEAYNTYTITLDFKGE